MLVDYLEESAAYLRDRKQRLKKLDSQYRRIYDHDIKKEMALLRREIARKTSEINYELLLNLEEFHALYKYYPELLQVYMEDEYIGKILSRKAWLLDYKQLPPEQAAAKLAQLRDWRAQLKDAKHFLRRWTGTVDSKAIIATFPILRGHLSGVLDKIEATKAIEEADKVLLKEGWLLLIGDSLIQIPIAKFMAKINQLLFEEMQAKADATRSIGKGTVAETVALRKLQGIMKKKQHYERILTQVLLANPAYLRSLKKKKSWTSREASGNLDKIAKSITPRSIKERVWLDLMRKKLEEK